MTRMAPEELFAEIDWFFTCGVSPELTATVLGKSFAALEMYCRRHGRPDLWVVYNRLEQQRRRDAA